MKTFTFLKSFASTSAFFVLGITCVLAQVKVGANPGTINGGSALEIEASDKGLLMPRVVLTNTTTWGLSGTAVAGMSVYNTSSVVGSTNAAYPATGVGEYYWDGTGWVSKKGGVSQLGADNGLTVGYNSVGNVGLGGALSKNTTVDQNGFNLNFTGSTATDLIGIGTASPAEKLHVYGGNQEIGGLENPILRLHSSTNAEGKGGQIAFSELDKIFGFYINHNTSSGTTYGQENLAIGARQPNQHDYDITHPAISVIRNQYVGLGTTNPLAKFHIDGAEDNVLSGTATAAQQVNDVVVTTGGLMGIGTTSPTRKLDINGGSTAGAVKIVDGTQGANKILTSDANGVGTWQSPADIKIPTPAVYSLQSNLSDFLNGLVSGDNRPVPMSETVNNTGGNVTFNSGTNTVHLEPGVYQMTFVYEATHDASGCTVSSYFVDFPTSTGSTTKRVHSTSAHNQGGQSNHGGTISFTTVITGSGYDWIIKLGRGQSGNCFGTGNTLIANSTQLTVLRY